jgi:hypothetical protein
MLFLPDVHVFTNVEAALVVSNEEGVFTLSISRVHNSNSLGVTSRVLGVGNVLVVPSTSTGEFSPIPHIMEGCLFISRYLDLVNDEGLECVNFFRR